MLTACPAPPALPLQISYCEETVECRRVMLLTHFGENSFTAAQCRGTCDNCAQNAGQTFTYEDVSEAAKKGEGVAGRGWRRWLGGGGGWSGLLGALPRLRPGAQGGLRHRDSEEQTQRLRRAAARTRSCAHL